VQDLASQVKEQERPAFLRQTSDDNLAASGGAPAAPEPQLVSSSHQRLSFPLDTAGLAKGSSQHCLLHCTEAASRTPGV